MSKSMGIFVVGGLLALSGCGGSSGSSSSTTVGGQPLSQYQAKLPDGSPMEIEILANDSVAWEGEFAVAAETGTYAHQTGSFEGTITGNSIAAKCTTTDGTSFDLTGSASGAGFQLTRSDLPGVVLNFQPVAPMASVAPRADTSFNLKTGGSTGSTGTTGRVTLSTSPYSVQGTLTEYRGTWLGLNVTFWAYSSGYATIVTYCNDFAVNTASFAKYSISDIPTATVVASSGRLSAYSSVTKSQFQFPNISTVSP